MALSDYAANTLAVSVALDEAAAGAAMVSLGRSELGHFIALTARLAPEGAKLGYLSFAVLDEGTARELYELLAVKIAPWPAN